MTQSSGYEAQYKEIFNVESTAVHYLWRGWKKCLDIGVMTIYYHNNGTIWYNFDHGTKREIQKDTIFYKLIYASFTSYLFEDMRGGFRAISLTNGSQKIQQWQTLVSSFGQSKGFGKIIDFHQGIEQNSLKKKIEYHCPNVQQIPIHNDNFFTSLYVFGGKIKNSFNLKAKPLFNNSSAKQFLNKTKLKIQEGLKITKDKANELGQNIKSTIDSKKSQKPLNETL